MPQSEKPRHLGPGLDPFEDESLIGFIFRASRSRPEFRSAKDLGGLNLSNRPSAEELERLAGAIGTDRRLLAALCYGDRDLPFCMFRGVELPRGSLARAPEDTRKVCPKCLEDSAYHRAIWDMAFISACPIHSADLLSHCLTCKKALRWQGKSMTRCKCLRSADLTMVVTDRIGPADILATKAVHGLLRDVRFAPEAAWARTLPPLHDLPDNRIIEFLYRLGLEALAEHQTHAFSFVSLGKYTDKPHLALARGLQAAETWPSGFFDILDATRRRIPSKAERSLQKCAGPIERWLTKLDPGQGGCIADALSDYRSKNVQLADSKT